MTVGAVVIGDALIDELKDGATTEEHVGGAALNVAVGLSRLGVPATLIAMVGDDDPGQRVRTHLARHGVQLLATPSPLGTSRAVSTRNIHGEPAYEFNDAARARHLHLGPAERDAIAHASAVLVTCFPFDNAPQAQQLVDAVTSEDGLLAIDPNPRAGMLTDRAEFIRGFETLAARATLVKVGDDDASLLYQYSVDALTQRLLTLGAQTVLATHGADGASIHTPQTTVTLPTSTPPGPIIDTMGAGDAVLASTVTSLITAEHAEHDWAAILARAMDIAAATCRHRGALLQTPRDPLG